MFFQPDHRIVREYPNPPPDVWRALTDPSLVEVWTAAGRGAKPVGFEPTAGTRFRWVARPMPGWNGIVECEVLAVEAPSLLRYTWRDGETVTLVTNELAPHAEGTRFTWTHSGFRGIGGFLLSRLLRRVRTRMLDAGFPAALDAAR